MNTPAGVTVDKTGCEVVVEPPVTNAPTTPTCTDKDEDGFAIEGGDCGPADCNDYKASINPDAAERCGDWRHIDENCNGVANGNDPACGASESTDSDGDGFCVGEDCNTVKDCHDHDSTIFPGQNEVAFNNYDDNCNGVVDENNDSAGADGNTLYSLDCASCHGDLPNSKVCGENAEDIMEAIAEENSMSGFSSLTDEQVKMIADALSSCSSDSDHESDSAPIGVAMLLSS